MEIKQFLSKIVKYLFFNHYINNRNCDFRILCDNILIIIIYFFIILTKYQIKKIMQHAIQLSKTNLGQTYPNPTVGCIITDNDNNISII